MNLGLIPIRNFAHIADNIYRSAQPLYAYEYEWLRDVLELTYVVNLRYESKHDNIYSPSCGIKVVSFPVKDKGTPTLQQAKEFIRFIKDAKGKVLIHCEHGHGRTSTFCVLAQIAKGMELSQALEEEKRRFHYAFKHDVQKDFLISNFSKSFSGPLTNK